MSTVVVGTPARFGIQYLDQNGQPMSATPSAPPTWTHSVSTAGSISAPAADGSVVYTPLVAGTDTLDVTVTVGGKSFTAPAYNLTINPAPQVLTSVAIVPLP